MKETGIIISGSHPLDIIEGRKTMTRRTWGLEDMNYVGLDGADQPTDPNQYEFVSMDGNIATFARTAVTTPTAKISVLYHAKCPYGGPGDRLWVRETWRIGEYAYLKEAEILYRAGGAKLVPWNNWLTENTRYGASNVRESKWRSSMFMPRWASRIVREITEVKAERLWDISEEDAIAEGIESYVTKELFESLPVSLRHVTWRGWYSHLWDSLNAKRGHGWDKNEWVWPISFNLVRA